jgi:hypothetical protein
MITKLLSMKFDNNYTTGTQEISFSKIPPLKVRGGRGVMKNAIDAEQLAPGCCK